MESPDRHLERIAREDLINRIIDKGKRLDMKEFEGLPEYAGSFENDLKLVKRYEGKFHDDILLLPRNSAEIIEYSHRRAEALEVIIGEQSELAEWFGSNVYAIRTTKFDDYFNGVDMVLEFDLEGEEGIERVSLAIDASSADFDVVNKKITRNINKILGDGEKAPEVKYFKSEADPNFKGKLENIIPVVIGIEGKNVDELAEKYSSKSSNKEMAAHPAQRVFLEEIKVQLEFYLKLLEINCDQHLSINENQTRKMLSIIENILIEKEKISLKHLNNDRVFGAILLNTKKSQKPNNKNL